MTMQVLSREDYDHISDVNFSTLQEMDRSPAHYKYALENRPELTDAMRFGILYHLCVFEAGKFEKIEVCPFDSFRSKDAKEWRKSHRLYLLPEKEDRQSEKDKCFEMRDALLKNDTIREMLETPGKTECVFQWTDKETGIKCKTRIDRLTTWQGWPTILDLKSTVNASSESFTKHVHDMLYNCRVSWTLNALNTIAECERRYVFAAQEKEPPYAVALYELDDDFVAKGNRWKSWLRKLKECRETGKYEAYKSGVETLEAKAWMR